jgi:hypothetical protein
MSLGVVYASHTVSMDAVVSASTVIFVVIFLSDCPG